MFETVKKNHKYYLKTITYSRYLKKAQVLEFLIFFFMLKAIFPFV